MTTKTPREKIFNIQSQPMTGQEVAAERLLTHAKLAKNKKQFPVLVSLLAVSYVALLLGLYFEAGIAATIGLTVTALGIGLSAAYFGRGFNETSFLGMAMGCFGSVAYSAVDYEMTFAVFLLASWLVMCTAYAVWRVSELRETSQNLNEALENLQPIGIDMAPRMLELCTHYKDLATYQARVALQGRTPLVGEARAFERWAVTFDRDAKASAKLAEQQAAFDRLAQPMNQTVSV